jgi:hypothetical protein
MIYKRTFILNIANIIFKKILIFPDKLINYSNLKCIIKTFYNILRAE